MKKFNELSEHMTEEEYRNNGRFHYSDIAGYMKEGFSYLVKPHKEESESLTFGSMVDCIVTEGMDSFNGKYCVAREFNLSDNQKTVLKDLSIFKWDKLEEIPTQCVMETLEAYYKNPKSQLAKLYEEGSEYYRFLIENSGKTPVDFQMFQDAVDVANVLLTSNVTKSFFDGKSDDVDVFFQQKFNGDIDGIPVTCMVDILYVEHTTKKIWAVDLKSTCANYEWEFPKSFVKYRYDCQGKLYSAILKQVMEKDEFYKDYELSDFIFMYISRITRNPLLWVFDKNLSDEDIEITTRNGNRIVLKDFRKPLEEMNEIKLQDRTIPLDISSVNDVMKHLNDF